MKIYMFRTVRLSIIRILFTVHSAMVCHTGTVHTAFEQDQDGTAVPSWSCSKAVYKLVWNIPLLSVQWINSWWWTDELSETCRFSWQNKFVKLVHLLGIITKKSDFIIPLLMVWTETLRLQASVWLLMTLGTISNWMESYIHYCLSVLDHGQENCNQTGVT
jgi:hypothetical protein